MSARERAAFLATSYLESGWNPRAVGDNGSSFGLFQHHVGGAGGPTLTSAKQYLSPTVSATERAAKFKAAGVTTGSGAAGIQRPANAGAYAQKVDAIIAAIMAGTFSPLKRLGGGDGAGASSAPARPKWSPQRDMVAAKARELGVRHNGGDRSPSHNAEVGGVDNSAHLTTRTDVWADDYAVSAPLKAYAESLGLTTLVHDAGSGMHLHIQGTSSAGSAAVTSGGGAATSSDGSSMIPTSFGMPTADGIANAFVKVAVLVVGLGLAAALIYSGVTKISGVDPIKAGVNMAGTAAKAAAV